MVEQITETVNRDARKLVEQIVRLKDMRSGLQAEINKIKKDEQEIEMEMKALLEQNPEGVIELDKTVGKHKFIVTSVRTGGGCFVEAWKKEIVGFAKDAEHVERIKAAWE